MELSIHQLHELHKDLGENEIILDVRRPEEFAAGHVENATNVPLDQVGEQVEELRGKSKIYIHCKAGGRARKAFEVLQGAGLTNLVCINEGMDHWVEAGYLVKK